MARGMLRTPERKYGVRHWKGIGARSLPHDQAKVLLAVPLWPGERVSKIRIHGNAGVTTANNWESPELNWMGLCVPFLEHSARLMSVGSDSEDQLATPANLDKIFGNFVRSAGENAQESEQMYGSDDQDDASVEDDAQDIPPGAVDIWKGDGMYTWFKREKLMKPTAATAFMDIFDTVVRTSFYASRPTLALFGVYRFKALVTDEFNVQYISELANSHDGMKQFVFHPEWVEEQISPFTTGVQTDSTSRNQLIRTLQGDNYIEAELLSDDSVKCAVKADVSIISPIKSPILGNA